MDPFSEIKSRIIQDWKDIKRKEGKFILNTYVHFRISINILFHSAYVLRDNVLITFINTMKWRRENEKKREGSGAFLLNRDLTRQILRDYAGSFNNILRCRFVRFGVASICDESVL